MNRSTIPYARFLLAPILAAVCLLSFSACDRTAAPVATKLTKANVDQIQQGMTQSQVQSILGSPQESDTKDLVVYKRTTFRYTEGPVYVNITFKNNELDKKETNIGTK